MHPSHPADPLEAVSHTDPYPYYAQLAARPGLHFEPRLGLWIAASAASVREVMLHPDCRVRPPAEPVPVAIAGGAAGQVFGALVRMNDGERQRQPKLVLQRALAGVDAGLAERRAAEIGRRLWRDGALASWVFETPVSTMASLIGFPDQQLATLAAWMGDFVACLSPFSSGAQIAGAHEAAQELMASFTALLQAARREAAPQSDSLLHQILAEADAVGWDDAQALLANLVGLLSQTYEGTAGLVGNSIIALARSPGGERAGPEGAAELVRAVGRSDPSVQNSRRFVAQSCEIGGARLEAGQAILLVLAAANRDPAGEGQEFGFGVGAHACPGETLARVIATGAMRAFMGTPARATLPSLAWSYRRSANGRIPEFTQTGESV